MRLVIYTHSFAPQVGGIETVVMTLAEGLARTSEADELRALAGTEISSRESGSAERGEHFEVTVVTPTPAGEMDDRALPFRVVRQPGFLRLFRLLREADLIHLAGPTLVPLGLCALLRKPVVIEHHGYQAICPNGQLFYEPEQTLCPGHFMARRHRKCLRCNAAQGRLPASAGMWLVTFARRWLCQRADINLVPTNSLGQVLRLPRTRTAHHGVTLQDPAGRAAEVPTFVFVGRLVSSKGLRTLLEAAARVRDGDPDFRLRIIGDGPERPSLESAARQMGLEGVVSFLGHLPDEACAEVLTSATAVVAPSVAGEVFGLAVAEAMGRGRLVIASDLGPLREVLGDAGLKFKPGDVAGLCDCLRHVLDHPEIVQEYGAKARERALELFRCEQMVKDHEELYRQLTGKSQA